jgi:hypothetical protein
VAAKRKRKLTDKPSDDHALRAAYLELYAARNARKRLSRIRSELGIKLNTLDRWMQDDAFVQSIDDIDSRRLKAAEGLATTLWPEIVERQAALATGEYLHQLQDRTGVNVYGADGVEVFGKLSDKHTPEELAAEMLRREEILERYRKRLEEQGDRHSGSKAEPRGGEAGEGA